MSVENFSIPLLHVIPACQHLHVVFSCFLILFVMISPIENAVVRVLIYYVDCPPPPPPPPPMSCGVSTKKIYVFWRLWSMGFQLLEKYNFITLSDAPIFIYKRCRTRESSDEEGHQFYVSADTCTCKPVVNQILSQDHTPCQWVFGRLSLAPPS